MTACPRGAGEIIMVAIGAQRRVYSFIAAVAALMLSLSFVVADAGAAHAVGARTISGHVLLPEGASTAYYENIQVYVHGDTTGASAYDTTVGVDGAFSIGALPNDTYTLRVQVGLPAVEGVYVPIPLADQYYPNSFLPSGASHIDATTADPLPLTMTLNWAGIISGNVSIADGLNPEWLAAVGVVISGPTLPATPNVVWGDGGDYWVSNLPVGNYTVKFDAGLYWTGTEYVSTTLWDQWFSDAYSLSAVVPVAVTADHTTTGVDAVMTDTAHFTTTPTPTINYLALTVGSSLGRSTGSWSPVVVLTTQWNRNGVPVPDATDGQYELTPADRGTNITVTVTGTLTGYQTVSKTSAPKYIPLVFTRTPTPTITGTLRAGYTLTAHRGTWTPTPSTVTYQWYRNSVKIAGATKYTYKLTAADKGTHIKVKVTGKRAGYLTVTKISAYQTIAR